MMNCTDITLPYESAIGFSIDNVFTKEECEQWIAICEGREWHIATINNNGQLVVNLEERNNMRVIIDDEDMAEMLWERIRPFVEAHYPDQKANGLNERLRFLRYDVGEYFKPHFDACHRGEGEESVFTVQLYLNDDFEGGETRFLYEFRVGNTYTHKPKQGSVLVFQQEGLLHEGCAVTAGRKYVMRSEVMYPLVYASQI
jgi:predicted 2-oxoglutarate/Fe(II)-dependent dioxygenase YbiX